MSALWNDVTCRVGGKRCRATALQGVGAFRFGDTPHDIQHVQRPTALGDGNVFQQFDATELRADFGRRGNLAFGDDGYARLNRNATQGKVASNPAGTAGGRGEGTALDDGAGREGKAGDVVWMKLTSRKIWSCVISLLLASLFQFFPFCLGRSDIFPNFLELSL